MTKSLIDRIKEVMKDPERIRNVATSSHVHHGKCVASDTLIFTLNDVFTAEELFEIGKNFGKLVKKDENEEIYDISRLNFNTISLDKNKRIKVRKITHVWKLRNDDNLLRIEILDGRSIKVTEMHKFICLEKGNFVEKEAKELKVGDKILVPNKLFINEIDLEKLKELILEKLSQDYGFIVYVNEEFKKELHRKILEYGLERVYNLIKSSLPIKSFYHGVYRGRYRLKDYLNLLKIFAYKISFGYDNIEFLSYRRGIKRFGSRNSNRIKLPKTEDDFRELFYLVGLMFGDGSVNLTFENENQLLIRRVKEICERVLGISVTYKKYKNKCGRTHLKGGLTLKKLFEILFSYPFRKKAKNLDIPNYFFLLTSSFVYFFVRGLFDTDGYVHQQVCLTSASKRFVEKLQLLLLRIGIFSYVREKNGYYEIRISGKKDLEMFKKNINFDVDYKSNKLDNLLARAAISKILLKSERIDENLVVAFPVSKIERVENIKYVYDFTVEETHNFVANGFFIHNTTLTDNLMAGAGMLAEEMAGKVMYTWFDEQERERQLTIYGANVSMVHEYKGKDYLINLVDTPGHVDFGGDVTRAMRAVDGTIVLICAVEGIMPQTETVFRQALRERVKPVLFINKVDRLIKEVKLTPQQMVERFEKLIKEVNLLIQKYAEEQFRNKWYVNVQDGSVAFGSAKQRWAISLPYMQETGITFKDIINMVLDDQQEELAKKAPLHKVVLDMMIRHLPSPKEAIKYRLEKIWPGDLNSQYGKDMLEVNPNGKLAAIVTKVIPDPHVGFVATARIFSGKIYKGKDIYLVSNQKVAKVQQVAIYKGIQRIPVDEVTAGNIVAIVGIPEAFTGETICEPDDIITPFVEIKHIFEPVVTKAIEPKNPQDLTKLIEALQRIAKEDSILKVKINQETGEYLVSGLGELHIEAKVERKLREMGFDIIVSNPIVVYREVVVGKNATPVEAKSPNKHNKFYIVVEPLEEGVYHAFVNGELPEHLYLKTKKDPKLIEKLIELGMDREDAKNIVSIHNRNILIDLTKGVQFMNEVIEMVIKAFEEAMEDGPLAREPCMKVKVKIVDAELHEDPVHRGPAQIIPAFKWGIRQAMLLAGTTLYEPKQIIRIDVPYELVGDIVNELQRRRAQILEIKEEMGAGIVIAKIPVSESFGLDAALKSVSSGRAFYSIMEVTYEEIPKELFEKTVLEIRRRKGLKEEIPKPEAEISE